MSKQKLLNVKSENKLSKVKKYGVLSKKGDLD